MKHRLHQLGLTRGAAALAAVTILAVLLGPIVGGAGAISPLPITCTASGVLEHEPAGDQTLWTLTGGGSCQGDLEGTYFLPDLRAEGTSDSFGLCGGDGVVTNLELHVTGALVDLAHPEDSKALDGQVWRADVTTFPVAAPFQISGPNGAIGAGNMWSRIFAQCGDAGDPTATIQFSFTS